MTGRNPLSEKPNRVVQNASNTNALMPGLCRMNWIPSFMLLRTRCFVLAGTNFTWITNNEAITAR